MIGAIPTCFSRRRSTSSLSAVFAFLLVLLTFYGAAALVPTVGLSALERPVRPDDIAADACLPALKIITPLGAGDAAAACFHVAIALAEQMEPIEAASLLVDGAATRPLPDAAAVPSARGPPAAIPAQA